MFELSATRSGIEHYKSPDFPESGLKIQCHRNAHMLNGGSPQDVSQPIPADFQHFPVLLGTTKPLLYSHLQAQSQHSNTFMKRESIGIRERREYLTTNFFVSPISLILKNCWVVGRKGFKALLLTNLRAPNVTLKCWALVGRLLGAKRLRGARQVGRLGLKAIFVVLQDASINCENPRNADLGKRPLHFQ